MVYLDFRYYITLCFSLGYKNNTNKIKLSTMVYNNKFLLSKHNLCFNKLYEYWLLYVGKIIYLSTTLIVLIGICSRYTYLLYFVYTNHKHELHCSIYHLACCLQRIKARQSNKILVLLQAITIIFKISKKINIVI